MRYFLVLFSILFLTSCQNKTQKDSSGEESLIYDLRQIQEKGELTVLTLYSSTSYFIYRGAEMGYQYELSKQFADYLGVRLQIKTARNIDELLSMLENGEGDMIAYNLPITRELRDSIIYCGEEMVTHQVIIQQEQKNPKPLTEVTDLIGKEIFVKPGKYYDRMVNLDKELGGGIIIQPVTNDSITVEDLITQVAEGRISYTVAENDLAQLNKTYYPNLNIQLAVSYDQRASWAVRKNTPLLAEAANHWRYHNITSSAYRASAKRYFELSKAPPPSPAFSTPVPHGRLSHFDHLFKEYAKELGWDWRLLASVAYIESNFDTTAVSWAGAKGLMQLMPGTARAMGLPAGKEQNPEESIKAATKYLALTGKSLQSISDKKERIKFILAAYNAGLGHVYDAMALAEKYGRDKHLWEGHVEEFILLKSNEEYFSDPVCKHGYFRGTETYNFVREVHKRYDLYCSKVK